jgi:hypothetical protein
MWAVSDVSEVQTASILRVEVIRMGEFLVCYCVCPPHGVTWSDNKVRELI